MKAIGLFLCVLLVLVGSPASSVGLYRTATKTIQEGGDIGEFSVDPLALSDAPDPNVDETYRAGVWDDDSLQDLALLQSYDVVALSSGGELQTLAAEDDAAGETTTGATTGGLSGTTTTGSTTGTTSTTGGSTGGGGSTADPGGGPGFPWEGTAPGGGSPGVYAHVVTNTGNRFTAVPLVSWPMKGAYMSVDLTLFHNSKGAYSTMFGCQWSSLYDANLMYSTVTGRYVLRWGDGQTIPFTWDGSTWKAPPGVRIALTVTNGIPVITTADMVRYTFANTMVASAVRLYRMTEIRDRSNVYVTLNRNSGTGTLTSVSSNDGHQLTFNYYSSGMLHTVTDPAGHVWTFSFTANNDLQWIQYPPAQNGGASDVRYFTYDAQHAIVSETDLRGNTWACHYNPSSHKLDYAYAPDATNTNPSDSNNQLLKFDYYSDRTEITLPDKSHGGATVYKQYYNHGKLYNIVDPAGFYVQLTPGSFNRFSGITMAWRDSSQTNHISTWNLGYDGVGNLNHVQDPLGHMMDATFDANNNPISVTSSGINGAGTLSTTYTYTPDGELQAVSDNNGVIVLYNHYDPATGMLDWSRDGPDRATDPNSRAVTTNFYYDAAGHGDVTRVETPSGHDDFTYNALGQPLTSKDGLGRTTQYAYDGRSRLVTLTRPDLYSVLFAYDHEDDLLSTITDEKSRVAHLYYDNSQRLHQITNARGDTEYYNYDHNAWVTSIQNGNGYTRTYSYSKRGDVTKLTMPTGAYEMWGYGPLGEVMTYQHLQAPGSYQKVIKYDHDDAFEPTAVRYSGYTIGTDTTFALDGFGRVHTMSDLSGTTTWNYDPSNGRLSSFTNPQGVTLGYTYFSEGRPKQVTQTGFQATNYDFDTSGRLASVANSAFANAGHPTGATTFTYNADDTVASVSRPNGHSTNYYYNDPRGRLTEILHRSGTSSVRDEVYGYDEVDDLISRNVNNGSIFTYGYDAIHQLTSESVPQLPGQYAFSYTLDYDGNGNRLHKYWSGGATDTYSYDSDDRLQSVSNSGGAVSSYTYDGYKRPVQIGSASNTKTLSWDIEDRLLSVSQGGSTLGSYAYNGAGARVRKTVGSTSHNLGRAGAGVTAPVVNDSANIGSPTNTVPGLMSQTGSVIHSFAGDQLGTRNHEIDGNGAVATDREYDAFGNLLNPPLQGDSSYGYAGDWGYLEDAETGLKQVGHRLYDPGVGRFLTTDPAHAGRNWSGYAGSNATGALDPSGLQEMIGPMGAQCEGNYWAGFKYACGYGCEGQWQGDWHRMALNTHGVGALPIRMMDAVATGDEILGGFVEYLGDLAVTSIPDAEGFGLAAEEEELGTLALHLGDFTPGGDPEAVGGVYALVDRSERIWYVGKTVDFAQRAAQHLRGPMRNLILKPVYRTADPFEAAIREQELMNACGGPKGGFLLNKINAVNRSFRQFVGL